MIETFKYSICIILYIERIRVLSEVDISSRVGVRGQVLLREILFGVPFKKGGNLKVETCGKACPAGKRAESAIYCQRDVW